MLVLQAILSLAALVQLWRTQMLPVLYLVIITALLVLLWLLVRKCLASRSGAVVARVLSVLLCAALASWAATALDVDLLRKLFGGFLILIGLSELFGRVKEET